jgi:hypothetical protein
MPDGAAIFETSSAWEDFSTPSRDLRFLIAIDVVLGFPDRVVRHRAIRPSEKEIAPINVNRFIRALTTIARSGPLEPTHPLREFSALTPPLCDGDHITWIAFVLASPASCRSSVEAAAHWSVTSRKVESARACSDLVGHCPLARAINSGATV